MDAVVQKMVWETVHISDAVMTYSQNPECPIRSSETVALHNIHRTALTVETLALVDLATINRLQ